MSHGSLNLSLIGINASLLLALGFAKGLNKERKSNLNQL